MKIKIIAALALAVVSSTAMADTYVKGHYRKDGTYVQPHYRSDSNGSAYDNYSTKGNTNPYTGEKGHKDPDRCYGFNCKNND